MAQTAVEAWLEEGEAKGELRAARVFLRKLLEDRFSSLPEALLVRIDTTDDLERLQAAFAQALRLTNLANLRL